MLCTSTIIGMVFIFIFHILAISISRFLYLQSFANSLAEILLSDIGRIYQLKRFVLFMFDNYYIWPVSLYCYVSSNR